MRFAGAHRIARSGVVRPAMSWDSRASRAWIAKGRCRACTEVGAVRADLRRRGLHRLGLTHGCGRWVGATGQLDRARRRERAGGARRHRSRAIQRTDCNRGAERVEPTRRASRTRTGCTRRTPIWCTRRTRCTRRTAVPAVPAAPGVPAAPSAPVVYVPIYLNVTIVTGAPGAAAAPPLPLFSDAAPSGAQLRGVCRRPAAR